MKSDIVLEQVADVADAVYRRTDEVSILLARAITHEVRLYGPILFETFQAWRDHDGSMRTVGEMLFCHPNTVRYRLQRIEQRTGRSLTRPRDLAELCLAFEVHGRLM